jgi:hypothetical protein
MLLETWGRKNTPSNKCPLSGKNVLKRIALRMFKLEIPKQFIHNGSQAAASPEGLSGIANLGSLKIRRR